ncbi:MAG: ATP-binding cassette domain-containing protein [Cryomorphaceae bacterium]|nr:MAG: ATP-binding cassette domain-containing protein [Cryomorphaceae bacterium]
MNVVVDGVSKTYGIQKAVNDLSFEVRTGEVLGFLGPNGAGKTTTMKMITQCMEVESGDIRVGEWSVLNDGPEIRKHIGYLPENNPLYTEMPVIDYLDFCARVQGVPSAEVSRRIREMVGVCGLNREKHKKIGELSKGYRQRVGLAQAMIHNPEVLILDEPTTGLDPNQIVEIRKLIKDLGREKTVILSTHILPEVEATCDRILIINRGEIVADGTAASLKQQASGKNMVRIRLGGNDLSSVSQTLESWPETGRLSTLDAPSNLWEAEVTDVNAFAQSLTRTCAVNGWYILEMSPSETSLEDIFRGLTL